MNKDEYKIRVIRGAFIEPNILDILGAKTIEKLENGDDWVSIDEIIVSLDEINELQKKMVKHYSDSSVPWYLDGYKTDNKNSLIIAFGSDDGEGGKIFQFMRDNNDAIKKVVDYGISRGIPKEQLGFYKIDF